jgi:hypothetical protein
MSKTDFEPCCICNKEGAWNWGPVCEQCILPHPEPTGDERKRLAAEIISIIREHNDLWGGFTISRAARDLADRLLDGRIQVRR